MPVLRSTGCSARVKSGYLTLGSREIIREDLPAPTGAAKSPELIHREHLEGCHPRSSLGARVGLVKFLGVHVKGFLTPNRDDHVKLSYFGNPRSNCS